MPASFGSRVKEVRDHFGNLSQEEFGRRLGLKKSAISLIENNERGLSAELIQKIADAFPVDPRWFFGQIDRIEEADLSVRGENPRQSSTEVLISLVREQSASIQQIERRIIPMPGAEKLSDQIAGKPELKALIEKVRHWDATALRRLSDIATGLDAGIDVEKKRRTPASRPTDAHTAKDDGPAKAVG